MLSSGAASVGLGVSSEIPPLRPHFKLHRHELESIFACLSFEELCAAVPVSHRWLNAAYSMHGLYEGKTLQLLDDRPLPTSSRLARHVSKLDCRMLHTLLSLSQLHEVNTCISACPSSAC